MLCRIRDDFNGQRKGLSWPKTDATHHTQLRLADKSRTIKEFFFC